MEMKVKYLGIQATKRFNQIQAEIKEICDRMHAEEYPTDRLANFINIYEPQLDILMKKRDRYLEPVWKSRR
ncbi:MAG: hypothetical protein KAR42_15270 [candidate division Zixibacteria bacterium]|nr:hypothetical protein [candidate division Zixibacteria bacterium]